MIGFLYVQNVIALMIREGWCWLIRKLFAEFLHEEMAENKDIFLVTADLGFGLWNKIRDYYPDRFLNCGASEQAGVGIAVGLAIEGKIPVFYSISTFAILRPFETIRNYLHHEQIPVKIIGGGRDKDYHVDGYSHDASDLKELMKPMNIEQHYPNDKTLSDGGLKLVFKHFLYNGKPSYLNLKR